MGRQEDDAQNFAPRVVMPLSVWQKMMAYIINCPVEINGFGFIEAHAGTVVVSDVFILEQTATATAVETDEVALGQFVYELTRQGGNPGAIKFQWHSHVNMSAYFSVVDTNNIDSWAGDWLLSLVANKRGEYSCRLDVLRPIRIGVPVQLEIVSDMPTDVLNSAAAEVARKVRMPSRGLLRRSQPVAVDASASAYSVQHLDPDELWLIEDGGNAR